MTKVKMEKRLTFRLDPEMEAEINDLAKRYNVDQAKIVRKALELFLSAESKYELIKGKKTEKTEDVRNFVDELAMFFSASK